jgi:alkane 1-monooxygenase
MALEIPLRLIAVLLPPLLIFVCLTTHPGLPAEPALWLGWLALALAMDALTPRVTESAGPDGGAALLLCLLAIILQSAMLGAALWLAAAVPLDPGRLAAIAAMLGLSAGTIGISAAHELVHRRSPALRGVAQAFMLLVCYPHFPIVHLRVHHPHVGTALDPGTSRLNESLGRFLGRAYPLSWRSAWRVEAARLAVKGRPRWHWRNRLVRVVVLQAAVLGAVLAAFGPRGLVLFVVQAAVAMLLTFTIDYTQHYGVVRREVAPGRLERLRPWHGWTADRASNRSIFNLGLHAAHHLTPALGHEGLDNPDGSLQAPCGYPGLVLLALVPPLWRRIMNPRLAVARHG